MNRLTKMVCGVGYTVDPELAKHPQQIVDRLAAYEDTGVTPEEIAALKEQDRLERDILINVGFLGVDDLAAAYMQVKTQLEREWARNHTLSDPQDSQKHM